MRIARGFALAAVALLPISCGSSTATSARRGQGAAGVGGVAVGEALSPRPVEVAGRQSTLELGVKDPARPALPSLFVALARAVPGEPRAVCFGTYAENQAPADGDLGCQLDGGAPLVLALGQDYVPGSASAPQFITVYGQADRDVVRVEVVGPGRERVSLPLSAHRLFVAAFAPSDHGTVQVRAQLADGGTFAHTFRLPLTRSESGPWPRLRQRGAVFDYEIGENITSESYGTVRRRFGPPLKSFAEPGHVRCAYYGVVGYSTGWVLCFTGQKMVSAAGTQTEPTN